MSTSSRQKKNSTGIEADSTDSKEQNEETEDFFEFSLPLLFNTPIINFSSPGSNWTYTIPEEVYKLHIQDGRGAILPREILLSLSSPDPKNTFGQAGHIWPASLFLSYLLLSAKSLGASSSSSSSTLNPSNIINIPSQSQIVELGAASGLPGILSLLYLSPSSVFATDYDDPSIIATLQRNYTRNIPDSLKHKFTVYPHVWGTPIPPIPSPPPDYRRIILAADVLYRTVGHRDLICSLKALAPNKAYILSGFHGEGGRSTVQRFVDLCIEEGIKAEWKAEGQAENIGGTIWNLVPNGDGNVVILELEVI